MFVPNIKISQIFVMGWADTEIGIYCTGFSLYGQTREYKYLIREEEQEPQHKSQPEQQPSH